MEERMPRDHAFVQRYGPWALILGASEGVGEAYAHALAERGVNVVLVSRRIDVLGSIAMEIHRRFAVETRTAAIDLSLTDAMTRIVDATEGIDVGTVMYCAGADPIFEPFLDHPVEIPVALVQRNCVVPLQVCHHYSQPMVARGKGAIVLLSSAAGLYGGARMVAYSASKAFDMVMGEALWAELSDKGVDVLSVVLGATDTPGLRRTLTRNGALSSPDGVIELPGVGTVDEVVAETFANLGHGPTILVGEQCRQIAEMAAGMTRSEAVRAMCAAASELMDTNYESEASS
jgi:short-subunit dehydrogenase